MKRKTIKKVIEAKIDDWIESIDDSEVRKIVRGNTIITGGCIASMLLQEDVNDFDVYFRTREATLAVANYYVKRFKQKTSKGIDVPIYVWDARNLPDDQKKSKLHELDVDRIKIIAKSAGIASSEGTEEKYQYFEAGNQDSSAYINGILAGATKTLDESIESIAEGEDSAANAVENDATLPKYRPVFLSSNAITLSGKMQLIIRFWGEPNEIHDNFDFVHCSNYYTSWDKDLILKPEALEALLARELRYVGSLYPIASVIRLRKFIKRGWSVNAGQIVKMAFQISKLDLEDVHVLENQLTGVDQAFFSQLIANVKKGHPDTVDISYVVELIDKIM